MAYYLDLFSPETYRAYLSSDRAVSGFRIRHRNAAAKVKPGDKLICYLTRVSRWVGILEVIDGPYEDNTPRFVTEADPFVVRFKIRPVALLEVNRAVPIHAPEVWDSLSFTKGVAHNAPVWTGSVRSSLSKLKAEDAELLESLILIQAKHGKEYELTDAERKKLETHLVRRTDKSVLVTVPSEEDHDEPIDNSSATGDDSPRESLRMQALLADIGKKMGFGVWIPRTDRVRVKGLMKSSESGLLDILPLNYDDTTLKTIEQIDVLWLKGRSIARAFEVEHTTSIYSGILRMADLLALQPNMDIRLHIVAPVERRDKVFSEIRRPVFSLLDRGPLAESCSFIAYDQLEEISRLKHLEHVSDSVLDDYSEDAE